LVFLYHGQADAMIIRVESRTIFETGLIELLFSI
jgi:hypothetical protein